ncbi:ribosomal-processing cysteine protease Prp [Vaginisenegalia massiliensis]|uniref:ribosomal-processing cysteine protease Prp n=1 Tax=Vaginisenegalia massiliensis TaxID=2058294 RepID=UPI000F544807|nr:ribosomal-processing cysteine protease Prp [Vaginisenegalia massiliensis]
MINIRIFSDQANQIQALEVSGHAGYAEHGSDIVCAAVSSQVISVENSLHHLLQLDVQTQVDEVEGGYLKLTLPEITAKTTKQEAQLLLRHLDFALSVLAESYPEYIQMNYSKLTQ